MSSLDYLDLCRLCLVKDRVSVPIFDGEGDVRQIFLKIAACLPVKVAREDKLPKKICDDCVYKVELFYQFWNTTANAEKQLLQWLGEVNLEDKGYVTDVLNTGAMKEDQSTENRLDGNVIQHVGDHQNNMGMGMMDNMGLGIPIIISSANQQQITSVPMDTSGSSVQTVQAVPGPSSQTTHNQISQNRTSSAQHEDEEDTDDEENSDEECDGDDGLTVKEESEEEPSNRTVEPTTFVNVPLACDEAGPSGLQQQKLSEIPEMPMPQSADEDPKSELLRYQRIRRTLRITPSTPRVVSEPPRTEDKSKKREKRVLIAVPTKPSKTPKQQENLTIPTKPSKTPNDPPKKRKCPLCDEKFDTQCKLRRHMYHHTDLRPYECDVCGNAFKRSKELSLHKQIHLGIQYECAECRFTTTNRLSLNLHQRRMHQGAFAYYCDECGKGFMSQYYLRDHIARHQGKKSHVCEVCSKSYFRIASLQAHKFKVHGLSNRPREYKCNICPKSFVTADSLRVHVENHARKFQCEQCGTEFSTKPALVLHILKHTGEKPYTCDTCGLAFTTARVLRVHSMIHTGEKPFLCDVCGRSFGQKGTLMAHCRNVHR